MQPEPAPPGFGIESTGDQVRKAVQEGKVTKAGTTTIGRQRVLELKVSPRESYTLLKLDR